MRAPAREFLPALSAAFLAAFELTKPVVSAVNGHALAGGCVPADELLHRAVATAHALATDIPSDTFAVTKSQLRRESLERISRYADEDATAMLLWSRRATDGWTAAYLESATCR